jgi:phytoene synthase
MESSKALQHGFELSRRINRQHGKSYYWSTQLFPRDKRLATYALYAFFRLADDIVDAPDVRTTSGRDRAERELDAFEEKWRGAIRHGESADPVLNATAWVIHRYAIPLEYADCFLASMRMDLTVYRYQTYTDLDAYMYGSAACVGLMMSHVIGFSDPAALTDLADLGRAMQLSNFLRDVDEDYRQYGRIYLPQEDLDAFGLSEADIAERRFSPLWRSLMEFEAGRAELLYRSSDRAIRFLSADGRLPVRLASVLYRAILDKLRGQDWNVFAGRASTTPLEKMILTVRTMRQRHA